jgi:hypothetical protein
VPSIPTDYDNEGEQSLRMAPVESSITRRTEPSRMVSADSDLALRQTQSAGSTASRGSSRSGGSVIRLAAAGAEPPYTIQIPHLRPES